MVLLKKFSVVVCYLLLIHCPLNANAKTAFIDIDYLIKNSNIGKKFLQQVESADKKNIDLLNERNKNLKKLELEIKSKKNIISEQDFDNLVKDFQKKVKVFTNEKNEIVSDFNNFRKKEFEKIFNKINPIISNYMKENSINILLDSKNIFMGNPDINLTNDILVKINNELK